VRVEPKEDIKSRLGRSPDYADALGIGWALTELMLNNPSESDVLFV
jgi:phage terminase large subunit-like protein